MLAASGFVGVRVAILPGPLTTLAGTRMPPWLRVNVAAVMVVGSITLLKVAMTGELSATAVALAAGMVELTTGGMGAAVVKFHEWFMARLAMFSLLAQKMG